MDKVIHKAKDNSAKTILDEPEVFLDFLRDYVRHVVKVALEKIKVDKEKIDEEVEKIYRKGSAEMFDNLAKIADEIEERGRQEGRQEGVLESAIRLIKKGFNLSETADLLNLTEYQIEQLKQNDGAFAL